MRRMVDSNAKGINARKDKRERAIGKFKRSKQIRVDQLKELTADAKTIKAAGVIVTTNFNEDVC